MAIELAIFRNTGPDRNQSLTVTQFAGGAPLEGACRDRKCVQLTQDGDREFTSFLARYILLNRGDAQLLVKFLQHWLDS